MKINLIWAQARDANNRPVIGLNGVMPWYLPEDLAHFKRTTMNHPVIMGRKTWESLPLKFRPLPRRRNWVISSQESLHKNLRDLGAFPSYSLRESLLKEEQNDSSEVWVIGGAQIYAQAILKAHKLVVTEIDALFEGDAFAPAIDENWQEQSRIEQQSVKGLRCSFVTYLRKA